MLMFTHQCGSRRCHAVWMDLRICSDGVVAIFSTLLFYRYHVDKREFVKSNHTTFSDGCLGSDNDEGRSEMRYAL